MTRAQKVVATYKHVQPRHVALPHLLNPRVSYFVGSALLTTLAQKVAWLFGQQAAETFYPSRRKATRQAFGRRTCGFPSYQPVPNKKRGVAFRSSSQKLIWVQVRLGRIPLERSTSLLDMSRTNQLDRGRPQLRRSTGGISPITILQTPETCKGSKGREKRLVLTWPPFLQWQLVRLKLLRLVKCHCPLRNRQGAT